ncbi:Regulatory protein recX [Pelosinus sp. UFO1]|nr:Regulatory protein recX [Pelosinus sp. UFO1]
MMSQLTSQKDVWQASLHLIARRPHSECELQQKLHYKDYSYDSIENVIQRLREYGYINDDELAKNLFNKYLQAGKYSLKQINFKMKQRGIPDAIIHNIISACDKEEWQSALKIVNIRFKIVDATTKEKIYRYLATKGFSSTSISKVIQHLYQSENNF